MVCSSIAFHGARKKHGARLHSRQGANGVCRVSHGEQNLSVCASRRRNTKESGFPFGAHLRAIKARGHQAEFTRGEWRRSAFSGYAHNTIQASDDLHLPWLE